MEGSQSSTEGLIPGNTSTRQGKDMELELDHNEQTYRIRGTVISPGAFLFEPLGWQLFPFVVNSVMALAEQEKKPKITHQDRVFVGEGKLLQTLKESLLLLFFLLPFVSAQCSTCLGGKCYDTGQCILGCVPGYMDIYCDKACPSNCLNKACQVNTLSRTISCTAGCRGGFCGTKCTRRCPEGCTTCDRQCGSCNMTLCSERRYGKGCKGVCNQNYEKCDRETGQCIKCRYGKNGDNCDRTCPRCYPRGQNLKYKCMSGCEMCKEQDPCPDGLFGDNCDLKCAENCGKSAETGGQPCNRATGECSIGCVSGHHGLTCNSTCSRFCVGRICNQHDGVCTSGCISGYTQKLESCEKLEEEDYTEVRVVRVSDVIIFLVIILVISLLAWAVLCALMVARGLCRSSRESSEKIEIADKTESKSLTGGEP